MCIIASSQESAGGVIKPGDVRSVLITPIRTSCSIGRLGSMRPFSAASMIGWWQPKPDLRNQALLTPKYTTKRPVAEVVSAVATNHSCRRLTCSTSHYNFSELIPRGPNLRSVHLARPHLLASELGRCHSGLTSEKASEMGLVRIAEHQTNLRNCHLVIFEVLLGDIDTQPFDFAR